MQFELTENEQMLCDSIRNQLQKRSFGKELESEDIGNVQRAANEVLELLSQTDYLKLGISSEDKYNQVILMAGMQVLAQYCPELFLAVEMSSRVFGRLIHKYGTEQQQQEILPALIQGKSLGALAMVEECLNMENNPMQTEGKPDNDGAILSGKKDFVINAPLADWIAVVGNLEEQSAIFLVDTTDENLGIDKPLNTLGCSSITICPITLNNVKVPKERIIGPFSENKVFDAIRNWENQVLIAYSVGIIKDALEEAQTFAKEHKNGGKPIIAYQEIGFKLAEMITLMHSAELLAYKAAWSAENNDKEATTLTHCAKVFCAENAEKISSEAMQILSKQGYIYGNKVEAAYRNVKYCQIAGTSSEISRVKIGDHVLRYKQ